jgi:phospholipid transport system substrate-binding protein
MSHINHTFFNATAWLRNALLVLGLSVTLPAAAQDAGSPTAVVKTVVDEILAILRKPDFTVEADGPTISAKIKSVFDATAMAQSVLSTNWRDATPEQQTEFKNLLVQTIEDTYLGRIKVYTNEEVEFRSEDIRDNRATVNSMIIAKQGPIPVSYKLRKRSDGWFVYDVEVENVSMVSSYRDTYRDIVAREGMDGLLEKLRAKAVPEPEI